MRPSQDETIESPTRPFAEEEPSQGISLMTSSVMPPSAPVVAPPSETPPPAERVVPEQAPRIDIESFSAQNTHKPSAAAIGADIERILAAKAKRQAGGPDGDLVQRGSAIIAACDAELSRSSDRIRTARLSYDIGAAYELFLSDEGKALKYYQQSLDAYSQYIPALRAARRLLLSEKSYPSALKMLDTEIRLESNPKQRAMLHHMKGRILEDLLHQQTKARQCYLQALELAPGSPEIIDAVKQVELKAKNWTALTGLIEKAANAVTADPEFQADLVAERARVFDTRLDATAEAAETYLSALALNTSVEGVIPPLKRLMYKQSRWRELVELLEKEIMDTQNHELQANAYIQISRIYSERLGNREQAVEALERAYQLTPGDSYILEELTRHLELLDDPVALINCLKRLSNCVEDIPYKVGILHRIGQIYDKQLQDPGTATEWHQRALGFLADYIPSLRALGDLYERLGNFDALIEMYVAEASATESTLRRADAHVRIAEIYEHRLGNPAEAAVHHAQALALVPGLESSFKSLVRIYTHAKQYLPLIKLYETAADQATAEEVTLTYLFKVGSLYEDALDDSESALEVYRRILRISPKNLAAIHAIQRTAETAGKYRDYADALKKEVGLTTDPKRLVPLYQKIAEISAEKIEEIEAAITGYKKVLELDGSYAPALAGIGRLYNRLGRWSDLLDIYSREMKASENKDEKLTLLMKMAELAETHIGDEMSAVKFYRQATSLDPTFVPALHALQHNLVKRGDFDTLVEVIASELDAATNPPERARIAYRLGEVNEVNRADLVKAADAYRTAIEAQPTYRPALDALARVNAALKRYPDLAEQLGRDAENGTEQRFVLEALFQTGIIYTDHLNDVPKAIQVFEKILGIVPRHVPTLLALIPLYRETGALKKLSQVYIRLTNEVDDPKVKVAFFKELARVLTLLGDTSDMTEVLSAVLTLDPSDIVSLNALEDIAVASRDWGLLADVDGYLCQLAADPGVSAIYLARLAQAVETIDPDAAVKSYADAAAFDPDGLTPIRGMMALAIGTKTADLQIDALRKEADWTQSNVNSADLLVKAAELNLASKRALNPAVADLKEALRRCPEHTGAAERVYQVLVEARQFELLIEILSKTAEDISDNSQRAELFATVARLHAETQSDINGAITALNQMLKAQPNHLPTMMQLVDLYKQNRQWDEAVKTLEKIIKLHPKRRIFAEVHLEAATIYAKHLDSPSNAIVHVESLLQADPKNIPALTMLCEIQFKRGRLDAANAASEKLLNLAEDSDAKAVALLCAAQIRLKKGARKTAAKSFREAIALGGPSNSPWVRDYYSLLGHEESWEDYLDALMQYNDRLEGVKNAAEKQVACAAEISRVQHEGLGNITEAVATLETAMKRFGRHPTLRFHFAKRLAASNRYDEAIKELNQLLSEDPTQIDMWRLLAHVYRARGMPQEGAYALSPVVVLGAATPEERAHAGQQFSRSGFGSQASFSSQSLWDISPRFPGEDAITALLTTIEDALSKIYPPDLSAYGLSVDDRLDNVDGHPIRLISSRLAAVFDVSDYQLYLNPSSDMGTLVELSSPVSIFVPSQVSNQRDAEKIFFLARVFAYIAKGQATILKIGKEQLRLVLAALTHKHSPMFSSGYDYDTLDRLGRRIIKATSWRSRRAVEDAAFNLAQAKKIDFEKCVQGIELGAVRAATLLSGDLAASVSGIQKTDPKLSVLSGKALVSHSRIIADLLTFWVSPAAFKLRKRAGLI